MKTNQIMKRVALTIVALIILSSCAPPLAPSAAPIKLDEAVAEQAQSRGETPVVTESLEETPPRATLEWSDGEETELVYENGEWAVYDPEADTWQVIILIEGIEG